jgi:hypothetical protein
MDKFCIVYEFDVENILNNFTKHANPVYSIDLILRTNMIITCAFECYLWSTDPENVDWSLFFSGSIKRPSVAYIKDTNFFAQIGASVK